MNEALRVVENHPGGRIKVRCVETGEAALLTVWATRISEKRGVGWWSAYNQLSKVCTTGASYLGLHWRRVSAKELAGG